MSRFRTLAAAATAAGLAALAPMTSTFAAEAGEPVERTITTGRGVNLAGETITTDGYGTGCFAAMSGINLYSTRLYDLAYDSSYGAYKIERGKLGFMPRDVAVHKRWISDDRTKMTTKLWALGKDNALYYVSMNYTSSGTSVIKRKVKSDWSAVKSMTWTGKYLYTLNTSGAIKRWTMSSTQVPINAVTKKTGQTSLKNIAYGGTAKYQVNYVDRAHYDLIYGMTTGGAVRRYDLVFWGSKTQTVQQIRSGWYHNAMMAGACSGEDAGIYLPHKWSTSTAYAYLDPNVFNGGSDIVAKGPVATNWNVRSFGS